MDLQVIGIYILYNPGSYLSHNNHWREYEYQNTWRCIAVIHHSAPEPEYHGNKCQPESDKRVQFNTDQVHRYPEISTWNAGRHCKGGNDQPYWEEIPVREVNILRKSFF